jgi:DNA (cytosine-5)-methyltransferase 3A
MKFKNKKTGEVIDFSPTLVNSSLVSAQNRQRFYWANWEFGQPEDKGIMLADVLECRGTLINPAAIVGRKLDESGNRNDSIDSKPVQCLEVLPHGKSRCLSTVAKDSVVSPLVPGRYPLNKPIRVGEIKGGGQGNRIYSELGKSISIGAQSGGAAGTGNLLVGDKEHYRKLTPIECEALQTVPRDYTNHVSSTQRYKMLGNGWTVDVITHIFKSIEIKNNEAKK